MATMRVKWKTLIAKIAAWMMLELLFNLLGVDQLVNYSEFLFHSYSANSPLLEREMNPEA
jgi:hypothetical protein